MNYVLYYLLAGFVFIFIIDMTSEYVKRKGIVTPVEFEWNWGTRLFTVLIWPLGLFFFLRGYIRERYFNNKNK